MPNFVYFLFLLDWNEQWKTFSTETIVFVISNESTWKPAGTFVRPNSVALFSFFMASTSKTAFKPENCYSVVCGTQNHQKLSVGRTKFSLLISMATRITWKVLPKPSHQFSYRDRNWFSQLSTSSSPSFFANSLNYTIHIHFHPAYDFNIDSITNETQWVFILKKFDIHDTVKGNILLVSLLVMGGYTLVVSKTQRYLMSAALQRRKTWFYQSKIPVIQTIVFWEL